MASVLAGLIMTLDVRIVAICTGLLGLLGCGAGVAATPGASPAPVRTFLVYYGGGARLEQGDIAALASHDLLVVDRFRFSEVQPDTWRALRAKSPDIRIFLYQDGPQTATDHDAHKAIFLNNISRYRSPRERGRDSIESAHPDWILRGRSGSTVRIAGGAEYVLLDFGNQAVRSFWVAATNEDVVRRPWRADGVFVDDCPPYLSQDWPPERSPVKYPRAEEWNEAMNGFIAAISRGLHDLGQQVMINRGHSRFDSGRREWQKVDRADAGPDVVLEEAAFAVSFGKGDVQFYPEEEWFSQVMAASALHRTSVAYLSHADMDPGQAGTDLGGAPVTIDQVYGFALASYLLAMRAEPPLTYFSFDFRGGGSFRAVREFPLISEVRELGRVRSTVRRIAVGRERIYVREFDNGYVVVNPSVAEVDVAVRRGDRVLDVGVGSRLLTDESITLRAHEAAIVLWGRDPP